MTRLAATGLVSVASVGNQKFYQANSDLPVFAALTYAEAALSRPINPNVMSAHERRT